MRVANFVNIKIAIMLIIKQPYKNQEKSKELKIM